MTSATITLHKQALASASTQIPRTVSVTLPAPPFSLDIDAARTESEPYRRISLCSPYRPAAVKNAYTKIRNAIMEVRDEWEG